MDFQSDRRLVFVDVESIGLDPNGPIRQIAAVAVDDQLQETETFDINLKVDWSRVRLWQADRRRRPPRPWRLAEHHAAIQLGDFLSRNATQRVTTSRGKLIRVAQLVAHNAGHDGSFLQAFFARNKRIFPGRYQLLCTLQRALWFFHDNPTLAPPRDFKLATLCCYFRIPFDPNKAHDALYDARATLALHKAMAHGSQLVPRAAIPRHLPETCQLSLKSASTSCYNSETSLGKEDGHEYRCPLGTPRVSRILD